MITYLLSLHSASFRGWKSKSHDLCWFVCHVVCITNLSTTGALST